VGFGPIPPAAQYLRGFCYYTTECVVLSVLVEGGRSDCWILPRDGAPWALTCRGGGLSTCQDPEKVCLCLYMSDLELGGGGVGVCLR